MDPLQLGGAVAGALATASALALAGRSMWRTGRHVADLHDDWRGEPERPGVPGRKGVMERLRDIEKELHPNSGYSLRDAVDRVGVQLAEHLRSHTATPVQVNVGTAPPADPTSSLGGTT